MDNGLWLIFSIIALKLAKYITYYYFFGVILYIIFWWKYFLVGDWLSNVPLYRAAYTVSLILVLLISFFVFDSLFSFKFPFGEICWEQ